MMFPLSLDQKDWGVAQVQQTAASALQWCKQSGGTVQKTDLVHRISLVGTSGKHTQNAERDFHILLKSLSKRLGVKIHSVPARFYCHASASIQWQEVSVIYPDDMANALYARGKKVWYHTMFGKHTPDEVRNFWNHCKNTCDWFKGSPCHDYPVMDKIIPMSFYGDGIAAYRGSETGQITALGWCSDFAYGNSSLTRYFPIAIYPEYAATEHTYDDIMKPVVDRVRGMVDPTVLHDWSSDGYVFLLSSIQGDLKFLRDVYGLHNYRANAFCSTCGCVKKSEDPGMTLADFRENAAHASSLPDLSEFHQNRI